MTLTQWFQNGGGYISGKIQITEIPGRGNALVCTEKIEKHEKCLAVPRTMLVNSQTLRPTCRLADKLTSHQLLANYLLQTENEWIKSLPQDFSSFPVCWIDSEVALLPQMYQKKVAAQKSQIDTDYAAVLEALQKPQRTFTKDRFIWAWICVNSRCLYWDVGRDKDQNMTLAPVVDFLNHNSDAAETVGVRSGIHMSVHATKSYLPGDEIYLSYGPHENGFLLCEYGFVAAENSWDYIDVTVEVLALLSESSKLTLQNLGYLGDYSLHKDGLSFRALVAIASIDDQGKALHHLVNGLDHGEPFKALWSEVQKSLVEELRMRYAPDPDYRPEIADLYREYIKLLQNFP